MLVPYSDNPNTPSPDGWTPIDFAKEFGYTKIIELLAPYENDIDLPKSKRRRIEKSQNLIQDIKKAHADPKIKREKFHPKEIHSRNFTIAKSWELSPCMDCPP